MYWDATTDERYRMDADVSRMNKRICHVPITNKIPVENSCIRNVITSSSGSTVQYGTVKVFLEFYCLFDSASRVRSFVRANDKQKNTKK